MAQYSSNLSLRQVARAVKGVAKFDPTYTRMVPAHHILELELRGCPDPNPTYTRFFTPARNSLSTDIEVIGREINIYGRPYRVVGTMDERKHIIGALGDGTLYTASRLIGT